MLCITNGDSFNIHILKYGSAPLIYAIVKLGLMSHVSFHDLGSGLRVSGGLIMKTGKSSTSAHDFPFLIKAGPSWVFPLLPKPILWVRIKMAQNHNSFFLLVASKTNVSIAIISPSTSNNQSSTFNTLPFTFITTNIFSSSSSTISPTWPQFLPRRSLSPFSLLELKDYLNKSTFIILPTPSIPATF